MSERQNTSSSASSVEQAVLMEKLRFVEGEKIRNPIVVSRDTPASAVVAKMGQRHSSGVLVTGANDRVVGIFTGRDYLDKLAVPGDSAGPEITDPIEKFMTPSPKTLLPNSTVGDAIQLMTSGGYRHVPLLEEDGTLFGLLSVRDVINFIAEHFPEEIYNHPPVIHQQADTQEGG